MRWPAYTKATKSDSFIKTIAAGKCVVKPGVSKIEGRSVHFADGSLLEGIDVILFGTGFKTKHSILEETLSPQNSRRFSSFCPSERFLRIFDPFFGDSIGLIGPGTRPIFGSNPTVGEAQVKYYHFFVDYNVIY